MLCLQLEKSYKGPLLNKVVFPPRIHRWQPWRVFLAHSLPAELFQGHIRTESAGKVELPDDGGALSRGVWTHLSMILSQSFPSFWSSVSPCVKWEGWRLGSMHIDGFRSLILHHRRAEGGTKCPWAPWTSKPHCGPRLLLSFFNMKAGVSKGKGLTAQAHPR